MEGDTTDEAVIVAESPHPEAIDESSTTTEAVQEDGEDLQDQVEVHTPEDYLNDL